MNSLSIFKFRFEFNLKGEDCVDLEKFEETIDWFNKAIEIDSNYTIAYLIKSHSLNSFLNLYYLKIMK